MGLLDDHRFNFRRTLLAMMIVEVRQGILETLGIIFSRSNDARGEQ